MPKDALQPSSDSAERDDDFLHTCACGEQYRHCPGSRSHLEECTSLKKFGDTCCCGKGQGCHGSFF